VPWWQKQHPDFPGPAIQHGNGHPWYEYGWRISRPPGQLVDLQDFFFAGAGWEWMSCRFFHHYSSF
jgi:hypothetical protein